jgi:hypothetical protein
VRSVLWISSHASDKLQETFTSLLYPLVSPSFSIPSQIFRPVYSVGPPPSSAHHAFPHCHTPSEIQELRHQSHAASEAHGASDIDTALSGLDERMESVTTGIKAVTESMEPFLRSEQTPTQAHAHLDGEEATLVRKHGALLEEWQAIQRDADLIREELREDKAISRCQVKPSVAGEIVSMLTSVQDFLRQLNSGGEISPSLWPPDPDRAEGVVPNTVDIFIALTDTFEAKKR